MVNGMEQGTYSLGQNSDRNKHKDGNDDAFCVFLSLFYDPSGRKLVWNPSFRSWQGRTVGDEMRPRFVHKRIQWQSKKLIANRGEHYLATTVLYYRYVHSYVF